MVEVNFHMFYTNSLPSTSSAGLAILDSFKTEVDCIRQAPKGVGAWQGPEIEQEAV